MRTLITRSRFALLTIAAGIVVTISGCTAASSPVEPEAPAAYGIYGSASG